MSEDHEDGGYKFLQNLVSSITKQDHKFN